MSPIEYDSKTLRAMFGKPIRPTIPLVSTEIAIEARKLAGKLSISGVQPKLSLGLANNRLVPVAREGRFILKPNRQAGIVCQHGADAGQDRLDFFSQAVDILSTAGIGNPRSFDRWIFPGQLAVDGLCPLENDPRLSGAGMLVERGIERLGLLAANADLDGDCGRLQSLDAAAGLRGWVLSGDHDAPDSCGDDRFAARRRLACVAAGFQCYIKRRPGRIVSLSAAIGQRFGFSVRPAEPPVPSSADDRSILNNHTSHRRIGFHLTCPAFGQLERLPHPLFVCRSHHCFFLAIVPSVCCVENERLLS